MKYTLRDFNAQFPTDDACLEFLFQERHPAGSKCPKCSKVDSFYRVTTRKCYSCSDCGHQISPTAGTIYHKSSTALRTWFHAIFLFACSKNGVSAKELQRQTGVTYKTAWRIGHQVRVAIKTSSGSILSGVVEADETYIGGKAHNMHKSVRAKRIKTRGVWGKMAVAGVVQRGGDLRAAVDDSTGSSTIIPFIVANVEPGSTVCSDEHAAYQPLTRVGYRHGHVAHSQDEWVIGDVHTNSIEGFWAQLKRGVNGTFHAISAVTFRLT